jgi:hypothetical protein
MWRNQGYVVLALILTAAVFSAQVFLMEGGLNNQVVNRRAPTSADAIENARLARTIAGGGGFASALGDGRTMPAYPVFLSWFVGASSHPWLVARFVQTFLASLIVSLAFLTLCVLLKTQGWALAGSLLFAAWIPFYYFSPVLTPETLSLFFFALFCYQLARSEQTQSRMHPLAMVVLAVLVYLKAILALLFIPFAAALEYRRGGGGSGVTIVGPLAILVVLILPWSIWVSVKNRAFIPMTTTSGYNLYLGTGVTSKVDTSRAPAGAAGLPDESARTLGLSDPGMVSAVARDTVGVEPAAKDKIFRRAALALWMKRPGKTASYGLTKVFHAFGFSYRHGRDSLMTAQLAVSLLFSAFLWRRRLYRDWCVFFWVAIAVTALQAFVFLPDQRFKTVVFDFPALLIIALGVVELLRGRSGVPSPQAGRK